MVVLYFKLDYAKENNSNDDYNFDMKPKSSFKIIYIFQFPIIFRGKMFLSIYNDISFLARHSG